jgi:hypothetical protein
MNLHQGLLNFCSNDRIHQTLDHSKNLCIYLPYLIITRPDLCILDLTCTQASHREETSLTNRSKLRKILALWLAHLRGGNSHVTILPKPRTQKKMDVISMKFTYFVSTNYVTIAS